MGWPVQVLRGRVVSGYGDWSYWLDHLSEFYTQKTGMTLYPGTLNLELDQPWCVPPNPLRLEGYEYGGRVSVNIVPCEFRGLRGFIFRTDQNESDELHHPRNVIEIAAGVRLRDTFELLDGDPFEVCLTSPEV